MYMWGGTSLQFYCCPYLKQICALKQKLLKISMQSQLDNSRYARSILSNSTRRDVLWNVSEPGDPYDIKKSMIAKLPGDRKIFMGQHLELVCLLQAAEIQRLCQFLDDYKLKFREIQRNNLDRHSYEIQIKELTEKVNGEESLKGENSKLKQFSKRLQNQVEDLQRNSRDTSQQDLNYKNTLERLNQLLRENQDLRNLIESYRQQMSNWTAKYQALQRIKNQEIQELKSSNSQFSKESYQATINNIRIQFQSDIKRLEYELKRTKEINDSKNIQINDLQIRLKAANDDLHRFSEREQYEYGLEMQIRDYQNRFVVFGTEIQRLNVALREYTNKHEESERRRRELDNKGVKLQTLNQQLQDRIRLKDIEITRLNDKIAQYERDTAVMGQNNIIIYEYQSKISTFSREIEVLSSKLKYQAQNSKKTREELQKLTYQNSRYRLLQKQNQNLKDAVAQNNTLKKRLAELQNKNMILTQQIQRYQYNLKIKDGQIEKYRTLSLETETLRSKLSQLQYTYTSRSQIEISRIKAQYQHQFDTLTRSQGTQFQSRIQNYQTELQRLRSTLKLKSDENEKQKSRLNQLEISLNRTDAEVGTKIKNYQFNLSNLKRENEELYNKVRVGAENQRKLFEYQNKLGQYERQVQRLTLNLKSREEELITIRTKYRELQIVNQKYEYDANKNKTVLQQNFTVVRQENQALSRKLSELVTQSNKKLLEASNQIERLGNALRKNNEQKNQLEGKLRQLTQENQYLKQNLQKMSAQNEDLKRRISQIQIKFNSVYNQSSLNVRNLSQQNEQLKKQINDLKNQANLYEFQVNKKLVIFEQNNGNTLRQNQELKRRLNQYEGRFSLVSQEIERLGAQLKSKNEQYNALKAEYQKFKIAFKQYENDVNNHMELQVKRRFKELQLKIQELTRQNEELKKKINENAAQFNKEFEKITASLRQFSQQNENLKAELKKQINERRQETIRFQTTIKQLSGQNQSIRRQFKEYQISVNQKLQGDIQRKINSYQENINKLSQENQELRRHIQEATNQFSRKLAESEKKYINFTQQYEKLRINANGVAQDNQNYKKKIEGYEASITNYEAEVKRRFIAFEQNIGSLNKQNEQLRRRLQQAGEANRKIIQYESRINSILHQQERVANLLKASNLQSENLRKQLNDKNAHSSNFQLQISRKVNTYENNLSNFQKENQQLKIRLAQADQKLRNYAIDLDKLNASYKNKVEEYSRLEVSIKKYESQVIKNVTANEQNINALSRQNKELKDRLAEYKDVSRRAAQFQNRIALLSQELERLAANLKSKQEQCLKLDTLARNQANQIESWKKKYNELEVSFNNKYEFEIKKKFNSYEQTISEFNRRNTETQSKLNNSIQQIERLNNILRLKVDESTQQANQIKNIVAEFEDFKRKVRDNQNNTNQNVTAVKRENEELRRRVQELEGYSQQLKAQAQRKISQYQIKLKGLNQQYERQALLLKSKSEQFQSLKKQFKQYEYSVNKKFQGEIKTSFIQYETHINNLTKQGDELKRRLQQAGDLNRKLVQYQNKVVLLSQEMERLNLVINNKIQQNHRVTAQNEELRRKLLESGEINRRIPQYEQKILQIIQQNEKLQYGLRNKTEELGSLDLKYKQLALQNQNLKKNITNIEQSWNHKFQSEVNRRITTYEQNITNITRQKQDLFRRKAEYQSKIALLGQQIERINSLLRNKTQEITKLTGELQNLKKIANQKIQSTESEYTILQSNYTNVTREYQTAKKHLQQYELSIRKLYTEFERLQGIINELKKENQTLHNMNRNLSTEINRLTLENKDLEEQASEVRLRLSDESALQKRISEHLALMVVLFAEIESLRNRIKEKEKEVAEVRRSSIAPNIL